MVAFIILAVAVGLLFGARTLAIHLAIKWGKLRDYRADEFANGNWRPAPSTNQHRGD